MSIASFGPPRVQRVLNLLSDGQSYSTMEIVIGARVMAVSAVVAELRTHGAIIDCQQLTHKDGRRRWFYTMLKAPRNG